MSTMSEWSEREKIEERKKIKGCGKHAGFCGNLKLDDAVKAHDGAGIGKRHAITRTEDH